MWFAKLFGGREDDSEPSAHPPHAAAATKATTTTVRAAAHPTDQTTSKVKTSKKGFDPYNSGSFDKNKAWERVIR